MQATLVYNPSAGDEQHAGEELAGKLRQAGYEARLVSGKRGLERRLEDPGELVVVAGGDGSVKRVALALAGRGVPMTILPMGTANNIAKALGDMGTVDELIASWRTGVRRRLRVGRVTTHRGSMRFVEFAGVGAFTELVTRGEAEVEANTGGLTGHEIDRALLLLRRIGEEHEARRRRVELDGRDYSGEYFLVEAMNIPLVGPNVPLAPGADWGDGALDLVLATGRERGALAEYLRARLRGETAALDLPVRRGRRVVLEASTEELHVDDGRWKAEPRLEDAAPAVPKNEVWIELEAEERSVDVLVPRED